MRLGMEMASGNPVNSLFPSSKLCTDFILRISAGMMPPMELCIRNSSWSASALASSAGRVPVTLLRSRSMLMTRSELLQYNPCHRSWQGSPWSQPVFIDH